MDPDGEPATDDVVDVMNMSFGGPPTPDDPVEIAVNNAAAAGVLSVISAGNSGQGSPFNSAHETIDSPGTAEAALTVGTCNKSDIMVDFSSKGPDAVHFSIKPEIVAPGLDVNSGSLNGGSMEASGTMK